MTYKTVLTADEASALIPPGATVMMGGFGLCGIPEHLIGALSRRSTNNLTVISNNPGTADFGIGLLLANGQVSRMIASYVGENKIFEQQMLSGDVSVELVPQGTLSERIRAAGAGIAGFFTPTGAHTVVADDKETRVINGRAHLYETALPADFALVKAWKADRAGNLIYRRTARNFNPLMATAAEVTVAEVEEIVEPGEIDPDHIVTPGIFVKHLVLGGAYEKRIEKRTIRQ